MSFLSKIVGGRRARAQKIVIYAPEGFGKSTIASQMPEPLFLDVEGSTSQLDVQRIERDSIPTLVEFDKALNSIISADPKDFPYRTLVIDTIDWLEAMAVEAIIADANAAAGNDKIKGIEDFGYGKGYTFLREKVTILLARLDLVIRKGVHVVLLAHSNVKKFEPPDGAGPYDRYELKLSKQVAPLIKEWCDALIFGNYRVQVKERDTRKEAGAQFKGVGGRERVMHTSRCSAWDAKNRHGLAETEKWEIATLNRICAAPIETTQTSQTAGVDKLVKSSATEGVTAGVDRPEKTPVGVQIPAPAPAVEQVDDEIPGIENPPKAPSEIVRICTPEADKVNAWLRDKKKVTAAQTFADIAADSQLGKQIIANPARFLEVCRNWKEAA